MTKILLSQEIHPQGRKILEGKFEILLPRDGSQKALEEAVREAEGIILRTTSAVTREVIDAAPKLKIISRTGAGVDNVDLAAAARRGILVCNLPHVNSVSVAEHAVALMLSLAKDLPAMDRAVRGGEWKKRNSGGAVELEGKTLGIVGMGGIGSRVAGKCRHGLGMRILAYDPYAAEAFPGEDYEFTPSLERLFAEADVVSLHCPSIPETRGMITRELLFSMKPEAIFVNCARGEVVDEPALTDLLKERRIAGAGIDVFAVEPPSPDNGLLGLDNVILSPHSAALTREATVRMSTEAARAVVDFFEGRRPRHVYTGPGGG